MSEICKGDINGICYATACFSSQKCSARDKDGNPKYADIEDIQKLAEAACIHRNVRCGYARGSGGVCPDNMNNIFCPFCGEDGFDLVGLKSHLSHGDCEKYKYY